MDDLASKLNEILGNPESMEKIQNLAGMLGQSGGGLGNLLGNLGLPLDGFVPFFGRGGTLHCAEALLAGLLLSAFRTDPVGDGTRVADRCAARAVCYRDGVLTIRLRR